MQNYLFTGGHLNGVSKALPDVPEFIRLGVTEKETYVRETLSVGEDAIIIYRHESLTPEQVLNLLIESYKAWRVNQPGGRR
jgi:hypothetical protein